MTFSDPLFLSEYALHGPIIVRALLNKYLKQDGKDIFSTDGKG